MSELIYSKLQEKRAIITYETNEKVGTELDHRLKSRLYTLKIPKNFHII